MNLDSVNAGLLLTPAVSGHNVPTDGGTALEAIRVRNARRFCFVKFTKKEWMKV